MINKKVCDISYELKYSSQSDPDTKQYFLFTDGEIEEDLYSIEESEADLDHLILLSMGIKMPVNPPDMIEIIQKIYGMGVRDTNLRVMLKDIMADMRAKEREEKKRREKESI